MTRTVPCRMLPITLQHSGSFVCSIIMANMHGSVVQDCHLLVWDAQVRLRIWQWVWRFVAPAVAKVAVQKMGRKTSLPFSFARLFFKPRVGMVVFLFDVRFGVHNNRVNLNTTKGFLPVCCCVSIPTWLLVTLHQAYTSLPFLSLALGSINHHRHVFVLRPWRHFIRRRIGALLD